MPRRFGFLILVLAAWLMVGCQSSPDKEPDPPVAEPRVTVTPVMSVSQAEPGQTFSILYTFDLADRWHLYWDGLNDSGFPPAVKLGLPPGWQAGPLQWPVPERHLTPGDILDHVYHGQLLLLQEVTVPTDAQTRGRVTIPARLDWLICKDECVPGHAELELEVLVGEKTVPGDAADLIAKVRADLPIPPSPGELDLVWSDSSVIIQVPDAGSLEFFPAADCGLLVDLIKDGVGAKGRLELRLRAKDGRIGPLKGILHQQLNDSSQRNWILDANPGG